MFECFSVPRIVFGAGQLSALRSLAAALGPSVLVVHARDVALRDQVAESLAGSTRLSFYRQRGEPTVADIDSALEVGRAGECTGVIGVGGGSAIDTAKAVAGLLANGGSALDYMEVIGRGMKISRPALPWIAIPTTAGTGAEVTRNAVIGEPARKFKASIRSEMLFPIAAIVDPDLQLDVPPNVTAASGMDALCQCVEAFLSRNANPLTDGLAMEGIRLAVRSLRKAVEDGNDLAARTDLALAALSSGICLTNAGLGVVHGFAAPIGAAFPAPHGVVCGRLLPPALRQNSLAVQMGTDALSVTTRSKLARLSREVGGPDAPSDGFCKWVEALVAELPIGRLGQYHVGESDVMPLIDLAKQSSSMKFNPVTLSDEALAQILREAF